MSDAFYIEEKDGVKTLKCRPFSELSFLRHGFSTRKGGVSCGEYAALNFSTAKESEEIVAENYRRFCAANGLSEESLALTQQTHTTHIAEATAALKGRGRTVVGQDVDGLVTGVPGLGLICFTADCVPILMVDPKAKVIAAVHSGWRGTVGSIGKKAVEKMLNLGASSENILAAIGPSIGPCSFEVGPEVQAEFDAVFGDALPYRPSNREGHSMVDLWGANRIVLENAGLQKNHIYVSEICTFCNNAEYYSHRYTNGRRGSLIGAIELDDNCKEE